MHRLVLVLPAVGVLGGVLGLGCGDDSGIEYRGTPGMPIPARFDSLIPDVAMSVDGRAEQRFLCDTGSPITFYDTTLFAGTTDGKHRSDLDVFGLSFVDFATASWDAFNDADGIAGLIGGDLLGHFAFSIDYQGERVWLGAEGRPVPRPADVRAAADVALPIDVEGGGPSVLPGNCSLSGCGTVRFAPTRVLVRVTLEGRSEPVWAIVDTGASTVTIDEQLFGALGGASRPELDGVLVTTVDGPRSATLSRVWRLELGGASGPGSAAVDDLPVMIVSGTTLFTRLSAEVDRDVKVFIGGSFLRNFLVALDYPEHRLRLGRYDDPAHIPADEYVGIGMTLRRDGDDWIAFEVFPAHDAYLDGVRGGDVIEEIDGMPLRAQPGEVVDAALGRFTLGQEVPMEVRSGGATRSVKILVEDLLPSFPPPS